jgi:hypothetical protein
MAYWPFVIFWPVKKLAELADGPTLYEIVKGKVFDLLRPPIRSGYHSPRDSHLAFRLKISLARN